MSLSAIALAIQEAGLEALPPEAIAQFERYLALLLKWNAKLNLTAVRQPEAIVRRHFIEGIQCAQILPRLAPGSTLLDFGSGAGLPGVPIAICRPEIHVALGESQKKKAAFLYETVRSLGINAAVFDGRIEEMPSERRFSIVTIRAADRMRDASADALERVEPGGWIVLFATGGTEGELIAALAGVEWKQRIPNVGLDYGQILLGQYVGG